MKKNVLILFFAYICTGLFAQQSIYVSATGNDSNDGLSEARPIKNFSSAVEQAFSINGRVVVIGTISIETASGSGIFWINNLQNSAHEITVTGKPNATGAERAVLSAKGSGGNVLSIRNNAKIRFEHIEISGGEGDPNRGLGVGITISGGAQVTLGAGTIVRGNSAMGIAIHDGTCIIDGGDIRDNNFSGVSIGSGGFLTLRNGSIRDNRTPIDGGGVVITIGGRFTMTGGTITGNRSPTVGGGVSIQTEGSRFDLTGGTISGNTANQGGGGIGIGSGGRFNQSGGAINNNNASQAGGGILVLSGGRFDQTGGTVSNNTAPQGADIYRQ